MLRIFVILRVNIFFGKDFDYVGDRFYTRGHVGRILPEGYWFPFFIRDFPVATPTTIT